MINAQQIGIYPGASMMEYHAVNDGIPRGSASWSVSRSDLKDIYWNTPEHWKRDGGFAMTDSVREGSLLDAWVTEPDRSIADFHERRPRNFAKLEKEIGRLQMTTTQEAKVRDMTTSLRSKVIDDWGGMTVGEMLADYVMCQVCAATSYRGLWLRVLIDVDAKADWIGDIKTTKDISPRAWKNALIYDLGYDMQSAMYLDVYNAAKLGVPLDDYLFQEGVKKAKTGFLHFLVSNQEPYLAAVRQPGADIIAQGRARYISALETYEQCLDSCAWPGYPNEIEVVNL